MYKDLTDKEKRDIRGALIQLGALPCVGFTQAIKDDKPPDVCTKGFSSTKCQGKCRDYEPDTREEVVERVSWVVGLQLEGLSLEQSLKLGQLKDKVGQ
jgi:hypothetical protein